MNTDNAFQNDVNAFVVECFGQQIAMDKTERVHRFLEESLELCQSLGCTKNEVEILTSYVFGRPIGEPSKEVGGVMVTLAALCNASNIQMSIEAKTELERVWTIIDKIRAKHKSKPMASPLPGTYQTNNP